MRNLAQHVVWIVRLLRDAASEPLVRALSWRRGDRAAARRAIETAAAFGPACESALERACAEIAGRARVTAMMRVEDVAESLERHGARLARVRLEGRAAIGPGATLRVLEDHLRVDHGNAAVIPAPGAADE